MLSHVASGEATHRGLVATSIQPETAAAETAKGSHFPNNCVYGFTIVRVSLLHRKSDS